MAPLVHMVFRRSRTMRDVIVMSCMPDLGQADVATALDLAVARVEQFVRAGAQQRWLLFLTKRLAAFQPHSAVRSVDLKTARQRVTRGGPTWSFMRTWSVAVGPVVMLVGWFLVPIAVLGLLCVGALAVVLDLSVT